MTINGVKPNSSLPGEVANDKPPSVPKTSKARDPDAMDVDQSKLRKLTNEEREKLWKERDVSHVGNQGISPRTV